MISRNIIPLPNHVRCRDVEPEREMEMITRGGYWIYRCGQQHEANLETTAEASLELVDGKRQKERL